MNKENSLTPKILHVIQDKGTEYPGTGDYNKVTTPGTYLCRQCGIALFRSTSKFESGCGWPSFDKEINDNVQRVPDADGQRTEIVCKRCHGHLGHVFSGERITPLNTRHCVNSLSLDYVADPDILDTEEAIFAAGCFWGVEYFFKQFPGVVKVEVGYTGGETINPTYEQICQGDTGHYEAIRVIYDPTKTNFESLAKFFFEIHDPTQKNGQGPDLGHQYLSVVFYYDEDQSKIAKKLIDELTQKGLKIATQVLEVAPFYKAETYHQDYYQKTGKQPYCHRYQKLF